MGTGTIWTETDVHARRLVPARHRSHAGRADDRGRAGRPAADLAGSASTCCHRGERVYRLLGCELTYHGEPGARPGETLRYEIHVDGHAEHGGVRLFFFHYDCYVGERAAR